MNNPAAHEPAAEEPPDLRLLDELEPEFSESATMQRLARWTQKAGRPVRVLHVGNIANNGYNNSKMLNAAGVESDAIAYDYYHIMGCPEWEDADIVGTVADDMNPDWWSVDLGGFVRPEWFAQGPRALCTHYLRARRGGLPRELERSAARLEAARIGQARSTTDYFANFKLVEIWHKRHRISNALQWRSQWSAAQARYWSLRIAGHARITWSVAKWQGHRSWFYLRRAAAGPSAEQVVELSHWDRRRIHNAVAWRTRSLISRARRTGPTQTPATQVAHEEQGAPQNLAIKPTASERQTTGSAATVALDPFDRRVRELIQHFDELFPERTDRLVEQDFATYRWSVEDWSATFAKYDIIEAYSTDPILAMLANVKPYVAYEHGTIRDIPFEDSPVGRLTALAYRLADGVVITNPDCLNAAQRLGVTNYRFIPHLIDRKYFDESASKQRDLPHGVVEPYVFCPARQHWDVKGNDIGLRAFIAIASERPDLRLVISSWGPDVERSRRLLDDAGVLDRTSLIAPLRIRDLIAVTRRAEVLIDQFNFGVFGGIGPTALACGTPLVTNLDHSLSAWCMDKPPYFQANDLASCTLALREALLVDRDAHRVKQLDWMRSNYWYGDVATRHIDLYLDVLDAH